MPVFLFTDIEGSTRLWQTMAGEMPAALAQHDAILGAEIERCHGRIVKHTGDGVFAVFDSVEALQAALEAALAIQLGLAQADWGALGELRVRIGLHAGQAETRQGDYFGLDVSRAARLMAAGWGGQVLFTPQVMQTCRMPSGASAQDLGLHLLKDLVEPQPVFSLRHPGLRPEFPALRSLSARPNNLPQQTTPFIGRQREIAELSAMFKSGSCRLVTLLGPGGMGKTRLSIQVAAELIGGFSHGVYFVPLAPLSDPRRLPNALADALKYALPQGADLETQLIQFLETRRLLLVFDNFEHLLPAADFIERLLNQTPGVALLVTSRERLNLGAECIYELAGLDLSGATAGPDAGPTTAAVEMFFAYARRGAAALAAGPGELASAGEICRLVGGMPLAIQLAAAWARSLTLPEIARELQIDLDFLSANQRDLPERHRSMRAAFNYSWQLLSPAEQQAFAGLSVFRGSFTREAARQVAGTPLGLLAALVDKSLLQHEASGRYAVHELLRQFAAEMLGPDTARLQAAHAAYYTAWLDRFTWQMVPATQASEFTDLQLEMDNLRQAWRWIVSNRSLDHMRRIYLGTMMIGQTRSRFLEAYEWIEAAIAVLRSLPGGDPGLLAELLTGRGWFAIRLGRIAECGPALEEAIRIQTEQGVHPLDFPGTDPYSARAIYYSILGDYQAALESAETAYRLSFERGDKGNLIEALYALVSANNNLGRFDETLRFGSECLQRLEEFKFPWFSGYVYIEMGQAYQAQGRLDEARQMYQRCHLQRLKLEDPEGIAITSLHLGELARLQHDIPAARQGFSLALETYRQIGDRGGLAGALLNLGGLDLETGDLHAARQRFAQALDIAGQIGFTALQLAVCIETARLCLQSARPERAARLLHAALAHPALRPFDRQPAQALLDAAGLEPPDKVDDLAALLELTRQALAQG